MSDRAKLLAVATAAAVLCGVGGFLAGRWTAPKPDAATTLREAFREAFAPDRALEIAPGPAIPGDRPFTRDGLEVRILSAAVEKPAVPEGPSAYRHEGVEPPTGLVLRFEVRNVSADRRWFYKDSAYQWTVTDDKGNGYRLSDWTWELPEVIREGTVIDPGQVVTDVEVFEVPLPSAKSLTFTIPGELFRTGPDGTGDAQKDFRFEMPASMLRH